MIDIFVEKEILEGFKDLKLAVEDVIAGAEQLLAPGDRFSFDPANFEESGEVELLSEEEELLLKKIVLNFAFKELGIDIKNLNTTASYASSGSILLIKTNRENIILGYDGQDWWVEIKSGPI